MSRIAYVNGRYIRHNIAALHIEDRATQFSDGVYEVFAVHRGKLLDAEMHYERLERSLKELRMDVPISRRSLSLVIENLVFRNRVEEGICYLQISRGIAPRNHAFPVKNRQSIVLTTRRSDPSPGQAGRNGVKVITLPDQRWGRRDIKSVSLLPNILAKEQAVKEGAFEAWLIKENGTITEGSHSNAWLINSLGQIITHPANQEILDGITRKRIIEIICREGMEIVESGFNVDELPAARETFLTSTSSFVVPVTQINEIMVSNGEPGPITMRIRDLYLQSIDESIIRISP